MSNNSNQNSILNKFSKFSFQNPLTGLLIVAVSFVSFFILGSLYLDSYANSTVVILFFSVMFSGCIGILLFEKLLYSSNTLIFSAVLLFLAAVLRISNIGFTSNDYVNCLNPWIGQFTEMGTGGIVANFTNYNYPYLYLLWFLGKFPAGNLYVLKFVSIVFDVVTAYGVLKLVSIYTQDKIIKLFSFLAVLLLPTVILNGAWWAQCDSIFTGFGVFALYFALKEKPWIAAACAGFSLAFKLQAIFILPIVIVLLIIQKVKIKHCVAFFGAYLALMLPALLVGAPVSSLVTTYVGTASTFSALNLNSASIFSLIPHDVITGSSLELELGMSDMTISLLKYGGIAAAALLVATVCFVAFKHKQKVKDFEVLLMMFIMSAGIPFLLPHMHDRYFFVAEIFAVAVAAAAFKRDKLLLIVPLLMQIASYSPYNTFLVLGLPIVRLELSTLSVFVSIVIVCLALCKQLKIQGEKV